MGRHSFRFGAFLVSMVLAGAVSLASGRAAAESFLEGALELDEANAIEWETLATNRLLLGDGRVFEVRGDDIGCSRTRSASMTGPMPASRSARFVGAMLVTPLGPWAGTSALFFGLNGSTFNATTFDCESGIGPTRTITLPANRALEVSPTVRRYVLADGSVMAIAQGTGSDLDETRYSTIVRLVPGETTWTGTDVFSSRSLRSLIDPSLLATFDRNLYQQLRIDDFAITPDGNVWMAVRQIDSTAVRGTWLIRWRPDAGWTGAAFDMVKAFGPGTRLAATIEWVPALGIVVMDGRHYVDPTSLVPTVDSLATSLPRLVPAFDGGLWTRETLTTTSMFEGILAPLRLVPEVADLDSDTLTHAEEALIGSSDIRLDSDYDGVRDVLERHVFGTDPGDGDSRPEHIDAGFVPRFGVSTRIHTSAFAGNNARLTYESMWASSPYLCASGQCIDGTGALRTLMRPGMAPGETPDEVSAMTADGSAWLGKPRDGAGIRFFDGTTIGARVFQLFALTGQLGATDQGFATPTGVAPYALTLPERDAPLVHTYPATLLGVDDTTNEALVSIDDARGQLVVRLNESGTARVLFRPDWIGLGKVENMTWLSEHDLYAVRSRDGVTGPAIYTLLDRALRPVGTIGAPLSDENYTIGRFFGRGYTLYGPGPVYTVGGYYTWFLAELVEHMAGLYPGDALLWSAAYGLGLWVYREDGTAFPLATAAELYALADEDAREALPGLGPDTLEGVDVVELDINEGATEACFATTNGAAFVIRFEGGTPSSLSLVAAADTVGCAYDDEGELHTLRVASGQLSVRDSTGAEVAAGGLAGLARGLFHARDASGRDVWVVDFIGQTINDTSTSACLRAGEGLVSTGFDAAGITVQRVGDGPDVVAWIDAVIDSNNATLGTVQAALVDDFCQGLSAERAHSSERPGPRNLFHQAYEHVIGRMEGSGAPDITVNEAAFALRPDGRYMFASRSLRSRAGGMGDSGMMVQEAGAWLVTGEGARIAAHDGWRRSEASGLALAIAQRGVRAMDIVPGDVNTGWGRALNMEPGAATPPPPTDAGVAADASNGGDGGETTTTEPAGCACTTASSRPTDDLMAWAAMALFALVLNRRSRRTSRSRARAAWVSLALAAAASLSMSCLPEEERRPEDVELFLPTSATWSVEAPYIIEGETARIFVDVAWDRQLPRDVIVQLPEDEGCYFQTCSVEWNEDFTRATLTVPTTTLPRYDSPNYRFAEARADGVVRVCTRAVPRRCVETPAEPQQVSILHSRASYVSFAEDEVTLAVGERRTMQAIAHTFSTRYGRADSRLIYSPVGVTYENLAESLVSVDENGTFEALAAPGEGVVRAYVDGVSTEIRVRTVPAEERRPYPQDGFHPYPARARPWNLFISGKSKNQELITFDRSGAPIAIVSQDRVRDGADEWVDSYGPLALRRWTGTGWSHEIITTPWELPWDSFIALGGDDHLYIGYWDGLIRDALVILDRPVDAPAGTAWRRREWPVAIAGVPGGVGLPPEFSTMPAPDGLWVGAHWAIGMIVPDEAAANALLAEGLTSNCVRRLQVARITEAGIDAENVEYQSLQPVSVEPTVKFDWDCGIVIESLNGQHNTSRVWIGPSEAGLGASPIVVTERFGEVQGRPWLGFTEILIDEDYETVFALRDSEVNLMQVHTRDAGGWSHAPIREAGSLDLAPLAARALTWSPGVPVDDALWDEQNWLGQGNVRLRPGVSVANQGAWILDTNLPLPNLVRHILPWGGESRDSLMSRSSTLAWTSESLNNPGVDQWASFVGGHGSLAIIAGPENREDDYVPGIWLVHADLRLASPESSLEEGVQPLPRQELLQPPVYENERIVWGGSAAPTYTQAVPLAGGRVALLGADGNPTFAMDRVQIVGTSALTDALVSPCPMGEGTLVGGAETPRVICLRELPGPSNSMRLMELDESTNEFVEVASGPQSGYVAASGFSTDGSVWAVLGSDLVRLEPNGATYNVQTVLIPELLEPAETLLDPERWLNWAIWTDADGIVLVRLLRRTPGLSERTLGFWRWTPGGGFEAPSLRVVPAGPFGWVDPARGGAFAGKYFVTTDAGPYVSDGGDFEPVLAETPFGAASPVGVYRDRVTGIVRVSEGRLAWIEHVVDSPGTSYVAIRSSSDGVTWTAPARVHDSRSGYQAAWSAAPTTDGALVFVVGDSRSFGVRDPITYLVGTGRSTRISRNMPLLHATVVRRPL